MGRPLASKEKIQAYAERLIQVDPNLTREDAIARAVLKLTGFAHIPASMKTLMTPLQRKQAEEQKMAKRSEKNKVPEHVLRNIARVKAAEEVRRLNGGSLPNVTFVSGGKVSPK